MFQLTDPASQITIASWSYCTQKAKGRSPVSRIICIHKVTSKSRLKVTQCGFLLALDSNYDQKWRRFEAIQHVKAV